MRTTDSGARWPLQQMPSAQYVVRRQGNLPFGMYIPSYISLVLVMCGSAAELGLLPCVVHTGHFTYQEAPQASIEVSQGTLPLRMAGSVCRQNWGAVRCLRPDQFLPVLWLYIWVEHHR
jgi:hypothetical protein